MTDQTPQHRGSWHWLEAERLLTAAYHASGPEACGDMLARAAVHAQLAQAAPLYAWHQEPTQIVADSPNILPGENEAPVPYRGSSADAGTVG